MTQLEILLRRKRMEIAEIRKRMTTVTHPNRAEINQIWETNSKAIPPGSSLVMYNAKLQHYSHNAGRDQSFIHHKSTLSVHPNQELLKKLNDANLEILLCNYYQSNSINSNIYSTTSCSLQLQGLEYKPYQIISKVISFDVNNYPIEYLKWFVPLSNYVSTPLTSFFDIENQLELGFDIKEKIKLVNLEILNAMGFTKRQLGVMNLYSQGLNTIGVAQELSVSIRTIEKHNQQILLKAKVLFPLNRFRAAVDVVHMLDDLGIFI